MQVPTDVHLIVAADNADSIGNIIMDKAEDLHAVAIVVASHGKKALQVIMGSSGPVVPRLKSRVSRVTAVVE